MADTIPGGIYKNAQGDGYHDANGNPVDKDKLAEAERLNREHVARYDNLTPQTVDSVQTLANTLASVIGQRAQPQAEPQPQGNVADNPSVNDAQRLAAETGKKK